MAAAAGAGGGAAPGARGPYPHWQLRLIGPGRMADIKTLTGMESTVFKNRLIDIGQSFIPGLAPCGAFAGLTRATDISHFYPKYIGPYLDCTFVVIDTAIGQPVGYVNCLVATDLMIYPKNPNSRGIFHHRSGESAIGVYVVWTCSFTKSPLHGISDYYAGQLGMGYSVNLGKYIQDALAQTIYTEAHTANIIPAGKITNVIMYSDAIPEARALHRKNGKMSACTFGAEWSNNYGETLPQFFGKNVGGKRFIYIWRPDGQPFIIGSPIYFAYGRAGSDLPIAGTLTGPAYFSDANYYCSRSGAIDYTIAGGKRRRQTRRKRRVSK